MANVPVPKSYEQILGDMLSTYMGKIGINDLNVGSAVTSFFETMAQAVYRASGDTFSILRDFSVDRAEGEALQRIAEEERIFPRPAAVATGKITITDTSFNKISTKIYAGGTSPNVGSTVIQVSDASEFPTTGSIYIGRGTPNIEGPIAYSSVNQIGSFWEINLSSPTSKFHNLSESVILSQGGTRNIAAGTSVKTPSAGASPEITFRTTKAATILDGEVEVTDVPVAAQEPGSDGNVPRNAIKEFISEPFSGAAVTNPSPFTTGRNEETDDELSVRIKKARISRGLGTEIAIKNAVLGAQATDENATVTSNEIFSADETTLFIDNGEGYEATTNGVGLEFIVDSALGGETNFQLSTGGSQTSIAKAFLESSLESPFSINPNDRLAILVGGVLSEHVFAEGDFRSNGFATAFEVVSSINGNPDVSFEARTIENGTKVTIEAKEEVNEFLQKTDPTTGTDAGVALGLTESEVETLKLYKNKKLLSRNGRSAVIESQNQNDWSSTITNGETLIVGVDNTDEITYTITDNDFLEEGTHTTVAKSNSLTSWVNVLNAKITGVTFSINGNRLVMTSNLGANSRAALNINESSTLVAKGMFTSAKGLTASGLESDFKLSRNTAQIKLSSALQAGDSLTAGSEFTRAVISSEPILGGTLNLSGDAQLWMVVDNNEAEIIAHGAAGDTLVTITKELNNTLRFRSNVENAFGTLQAGDYFIIWSDELSAGNRLEGRVNAVGTDVLSNDYFEFVVTSNEYAAAVAEADVDFKEGLKFVRSDVAPQKIEVVAGSYNINSVASDIENLLIGVEVTVEDEEILNFTTKTMDTEGGILIVTFNESGKNLNLTEGASSASSFSHFGSVESGNDDTSFPLFIHSKSTTEHESDPSNSFIDTFDSAIDLEALGVDPNQYVCMLKPYSSNGNYVDDMQGSGECVQINELNSNTIDIADDKIIKRIRVDDRYYLASTYDFDFNDTLTIVLDNNASEKTFPINLFRRAIVNTTMPVNADEFRAYDTESGATTEFEQFFGSDFDFSNYKAMMRARIVLDPESSTNEDAILYRSAEWGKGGERFNVGYIYPTSADLGVHHSIVLNESVNIRIGLKSGPVVANNIDGTTEWDVTITPNTPVAGVDEVTYTHNGTGTNPAMVTLLPGHFVTINNNGEFDPANTGTFRISSATSTSFTIRRANGEAVAENNIATLNVGVISLYENSDTTAQEIVDYVTNNLTDWTDAELVDDSGTSGSGVINLSTPEDNDFDGTESVSFVDGINWIKSSDLDAVAPNPQFEFKKTLLMPSFDTNTVEAYKFSEGEEVRFIPTTTVQLEEFLKVLAVTGLTTLGEVRSSLREQRIQFNSQILGSAGAVQVSGGNSNTSIAKVLGTSSIAPDTELAKTSITRSSANGLHVGQYVKLEAETVQKKETGISFTTQATIVPNSPGATQSTITLSNREITDRYFGRPRNHVRTRGRTFYVEKHGSLVCITWDESTGGSPVFNKTVEFDDDGGNMSVVYDADTQSTQYIVQSGDRNFIEANIGDEITIQNFTDSANNGTFKVNGISDDGLTISTDNTGGVNAASAAVGIGDIVITTEISEGDTVVIDEPFAALNRGKFRVVRRYEQSIYIDNPLAVEERVFMSDNLRSLGFDGTTQFDVTVDGDMVITWNTNGTQPTLSEAKMGDELTIGAAFLSENQGTFMVTESGDNYIKVANSQASAQSNVVVSSSGADIFECQSPSMVFSDYESSNAGDILVISGNVLGAGSKGNHVVAEVLSRETIIVNSVLDTQTNEQLNDLSVQVYIEEEKPYVGYKRIYSKIVDIANDTRSCLLFDSDNQFSKINEASGVSVSAVNKFGFSSSIVRGIDSYKYHTGLIAQSNKIVYGDPRDSVTFPGVAAAGAEIFIEPPLVRRIEVSVNVRVQTGIAFSKIVEQARNNIAALVNSSPIGESIAISDIVATVNSIPGTTAVSITSPAYSPSNDVIVINPSEKPFILDIVNDITVSKVE